MCSLTDIKNTLRTALHTTLEVSAESSVPDSANIWYIGKKT